MEYKIVEFFGEIGSPWVNSLTSFVNQTSFLIVLWTVITLIIFYFGKNRGKEVLIAVIISLIFHFAISEGIIKHLLSGEFFRVRPYLSNPDGIVPIGFPYEDSSFPSSHMASTLAVLSVYFYYYRKWWLPMLLFAVFMAFCRMHNGMHYPTDVLAGTVLGIIYGVLAVKITKKFLKINNLWQKYSKKSMN